MVVKFDMFYAVDLAGLEVFIRTSNKPKIRHTVLPTEIGVW